MRTPWVVLFSLSIVSFAAAQKENQTLTGDFDCEAAGAYSLCQNLWGKSTGTGHQNTTLIEAMGNQVSWSTEYQWDGGTNQVKSYANVEHITAKGVKLSDVSSVPSVWNWIHQAPSSDLRADVAYDLWLGTTPTGSPASTESSYEIMIWLSALGGASPIGSPIEYNITIGGVTWNLWSGPNSNWHVFSFISTQGDVGNFNADLNDFFAHLVKKNGVKTSLYIQSLQAGTEPFAGSAVLITTVYSVVIKTKDENDEPPSSAPPASTTVIVTPAVTVSSGLLTQTSTSASAPTHSPATGTVRALGRCALKRPSRLAQRSLPTSPADFSLARRQHKRSLITHALTFDWWR
ncbi:concanavalin A-like lectin/glucanase domain-containing protein [Auriculariales sp. MPI-PUGE-AT-0066]|nr:concanavalin A-like lectin/glucanase domain-containing protein [Auriculariales sp. MPI-PUGE-AT-0066]